MMEKWQIRSYLSPIAIQHLPMTLSLGIAITVSVSLYLVESSTKGQTVTTSSTEAELLAISLTVKLFIQWLRFFEYLQFNIQEKPTILCDNLQTIRILTKESPKLQTALKHVDIHQSWLRQEVQKGSINVEWVATADMVADGFTKLFLAQKQADFVRQLNLVDIKEKLVPQEALSVNVN